MLKPLAILSFSLICLGLPGFAQPMPAANTMGSDSRIQLSPLPQSNQSLDSYQSLNQEGNPLSVSLRMADSPQQARVFHPNGKGKLSDLFSPYAYQNVVNTQLFHLTVRNNEGRMLAADQLKIQVSLNGLPYTYLDANTLKKQWRHYYYLNTNTITGAPDFMEQERAITAEKHIDQHSFKAMDLPPGGQSTGLIAIPALEQAGNVRIKVTHMGQSMPQSFVFDFQAKAL